MKRSIGDADAFLVVAFELQGKGNEGFNTTRVAVALGLGAQGENDVCDALAHADPQLLEDLTYPKARLTEAGRAKARELIKGDLPLGHWQARLLLTAFERFPRGQPFKYADVYRAAQKAAGSILAQGDCRKVANAIAGGLAREPYRYVAHAKTKGTGSLTDRGRVQARAMVKQHKAQVEERLGRIRAATAELESSGASAKLPPWHPGHTDPLDPGAETATPVRSSAPPAHPPVAEGKGGIQKCWVEAYQSFRRAILAPGAPPPKPLKGVWLWLKEQDPDTEYELPAFPTWSKYVRAYQRAVNGPRNATRRGRRGRSTAGPDDI